MAAIRILVRGLLCAAGVAARDNRPLIRMGCPYRSEGACAVACTSQRHAGAGSASREPPASC